MGFTLFFPQFSADVQANFPIMVQTTLPSTFHATSSKLLRGSKASDWDHWGFSAQQDKSLVDLGLGDANMATQEWVEQWPMFFSSFRRHFRTCNCRLY